MTALRWLAALVLFGTLLFLSLDNAQPVTLRFLRLAEVEAPLVFVVFVAFAIGAAVGVAAGALRNARLRRQLRRVRRDAGRAVGVPAPHGAAPGATRDVPRAGTH
jgi:uncharacterized integral membrane protein